MVLQEKQQYEALGMQEKHNNKCFINFSIKFNDARDLFNNRFKSFARMKEELKLKKGHKKRQANCFCSFYIETISTEEQKRRKNKMTNFYEVNKNVLITC